MFFWGGLYLMIAEKTMLKLQGCGAILQQCFHNVLQLMEIQHVRSVAQGMVWVGMHFKEIALCAEGFCRQRHGRRILAVTACTAISAAWTLHAVGAVHDDAVCPLAHERKIPKIYYEVVVAEGIASFCQPYFCSASFSHLSIGGQGRCGKLSFRMQAGRVLFTVHTCAAAAVEAARRAERAGRS